MKRVPPPASRDQAENNRVDLATPAQVAQHLGGSIQTLAIWRMKGTGPKWMKVGHLCRYRWSDIDDWLDEQTNSGSEAA